MPRDAPGVPPRIVAPRKANKTGRAGRVDRKRMPKTSPKACGFEQFAWQGLELLESPAWRAMSPNTRRLIDRLQVEQAYQAGAQNGELIISYEQFEEYGIGKNYVSGAIEEAEFLGLLRTRRGGKSAGRNHPNRYRLTWIGGWDRNGEVIGATHEWQQRTEEEIAAWRADRQDRRVASRARKARQKIQKSPPN